MVDVLVSEEAADDGVLEAETEVAVAQVCGSQYLSIVVSPPRDNLQQSS